MFKKIVSLAALLALSVSLSAGVSPAHAKGGSGGGGTGGSNKTVEARVTGYITSIDYEKGLITVGASYYGTGVLHVSNDTSVSMDNVSCDFEDLQVGDWCEARYDYATGTATKLACTTVPSS